MLMLVETSLIQFNLCLMLLSMAVLKSSLTTMYSMHLTSHCNT